MVAVRSSYGTLTFEGNSIVLRDVKPHVAIKLKSMFARISKTQVSFFKLPATDEMCNDLTWFMERYPLDMDDKTRRRLRAGSKKFTADRDALEAIMLPDWQTPSIVGFRPGYALTHAQSQAAEVLRRRRSLLLGDDVGLGKTWVAMAAAMRGGPTIVVVQAHLPQQWVEEYIVPYTTMTVHVIDSTTPYSLPKADIYVISYSKLSGWVDIFATGIFKRVVYDEIQELRTGNASDKGRAARVLSDNAEERLGLSATPVFNYGSEIWSIMRCLDADLLGSFEDFTREWCKIVNDKWVVTDPDALGEYLFETGALIRRLREGRPINRIVITVDHDEDALSASDDLAKILASKVLHGSFSEAGQAGRELDALARRMTGLAKAKSVAAYAKILLTNGVPVIISGWHRDVYEIWMDELKDFNPMLYTGSETAAKKTKVKKAFMMGSKFKNGTDCMIISNRSGAGLDGLQKRCSTVIVGELDWSPQIYEQLFGRVDRPGQMDAEITGIFLVAEAGSDPTIMAVNAFKRHQAKGIMDPGSGETPVYSDVSQIKQLALRYLEKEAA